MSSYTETSDTSFNRVLEANAEEGFLHNKICKQPSSTALSTPTIKKPQYRKFYPSVYNKDKGDRTDTGAKAPGQSKSCCNKAGVTKKRQDNL